MRDGRSAYPTRVVNLQVIPSSFFAETCLADNKQTWHPPNQPPTPNQHPNPNPSFFCWQLAGGGGGRERMGDWRSAGRPQAAAAQQQQQAGRRAGPPGPWIEIAAGSGGYIAYRASRARVPAPSSQLPAPSAAVGGVNQSGRGFGPLGVGFGSPCHPNPSFFCWQLAGGGGSGWAIGDQQVDPRQQQQQRSSSSRQGAGRAPLGPGSKLPRGLVGIRVYRISRVARPRPSSQLPAPSSQRGGVNQSGRGFGPLGVGFGSPCHLPSAIIRIKIRIRI
jgi:hypothetical protein